MLWIVLFITVVQSLQCNKIDINWFSLPTKHLIHAETSSSRRVKAPTMTHISNAIYSEKYFELLQRAWYTNCKEEENQFDVCIQRCSNADFFYLKMHVSTVHGEMFVVKMQRVYKKIFGQESQS